MADLFFRLFVKGYDADGKNSPSVRRACGSAVAVVGIVANLLLAAIKLFAGIISGAISITADAVNNLTDAASSGVSLIGFNIAAKPADDEHPFGHGRMEDISALIVAVIVTALALDLGKSAIEKIISPSEVKISIVQCIFLLFTVFMKFFLFVYLNKQHMHLHH